MKSFVDFMTLPSNPHRIKKVAVVCGARPRGAGHAFGVRYHAERLGLDIVFEERVGEPPVDYPDVLRRAHAAGPDVLLWDLEARADDGKNAVAAAVGAGFAPSQIWLSDNPSQRGKELSGMFSRCTWLPNDPSPTSRRFVSDFKEMWGYVPEYHSAGGYSCGQVLHQAVNATGTLDNKVLREAVVKMTFDTALGPIRFEEDGMPIADFPLAQWQGDTPEMVYPDRVKTADAIFD
jgi:branched-chain amino acid transport system substrate-binding protein